MQTKSTIRWTGLTLIIFACLGTVIGLAQSISRAPGLVANDLAQAATWAPPNQSDFEQAFSAWLKSTNADAKTIERVTASISAELSGGQSNEVIDAVIECIVIVRPDVNTLRETLSAQKSGLLIPNFSSLLDDPSEHEFLQNHVRLYLARWLAQNELYDEAIEHLEKIQVEQVLDPMSLLFYRGLMEHQLLRKDDCLKTINKLLENPDALPRRYEVLSRLMLADIQPLEPDSLDEISRLMGDIRRRTGLYRSGKLVLGQEEEVIMKLDKLIEKLESQQQPQSTAGNSESSSPMQDSMKMPGKGSGQVTSKQIKEGGSWGDLPPAQRAAALAEMAKDMPPHYREVIEEYFRRLANENDR